MRTKKSQAARKTSRFPTAAGMRGKRRRQMGTRPHRSGKKATPFPLAADGDDIGSGREKQWQRPLPSPLRTGGRLPPSIPPNWGEVAAPESAAEVTSKASPSWGRLEGAVSAPRVLSSSLSLLPLLLCEALRSLRESKVFYKLTAKRSFKNLESTAARNYSHARRGMCFFRGVEAFFSETALFSRLNGSFSEGNGAVFLRKQMPFFCLVTHSENPRCPYSYPPTADFCPPTSDSFQKTAPFLGEP